MRTVIYGLFLIGAASPAQASDRPDWSGWHAGVNVDRTSLDAGGESYGYDSYGHSYGFKDALDLNLKIPSNPSKISGDVWLGYDRQYNNMVYGARIDFIAPAQSLKGCHSFDNAQNYFYGPHDNKLCEYASSWGNTEFSFKEKWVTTVDAKIGYAFDSALVYGVGGLSLGRVKSNVTANCPQGCGAEASAPTGVFSSSITASQWGWNLGGGASLAISKHWSGSIEYNYIDLGVLSNRNLIPNQYGSENGITKKMSFSIMKVGVGYKF